ncbi:PIR Superfamily Protein [Plasmodium ovale wallikeri]|uniref:PIR Superfamily Protein n=1 Tax=Plasmodium ovale wallikeri TaxID=864142 RepID=A0A1A9ARL6_PLAOA|nr:PIR Superfamily Protein [Plasmodium ovale wallikeri]
MIQLCAAYKKHILLYPYLSSFVQYQQNFNQIINGSGGDASYETRCSQISSDQFQGNDIFSNRCYEIAKYLNYISKQNDGDTYKRCAHLNYTLNSNSGYYTMADYSKSDLIKAYSGISSKWNDTCYGKIELIDDAELEKLKEIYNMHELFYKVKLNATPCSGDCCSNITQCVSIYNKYIDNCYADSMDYICQEISKLKHEYDDHMKTFTPFGTLVRPRIHQIKTFLNNIYEEDQYKTIDNSEFVEQTEEKGSYQIAYNSS